MADFWGQLYSDPSVSEVGGAHNNEGVDYSRYLAMSLIVEREIAGATDYAVVFEYLQDIALLDSASEPKSAVLIQVKKKHPGLWSKADLCRQRKAKTDTEVASAPAPNSKKKLVAQSHLGKLYLCVQKLGADVPTTGLFLSNAGFDLVHKDGKRVPDYMRTLLADLDANDTHHIRDKLHAELKLGKHPDLSLMMVEQSRIIPAAMRETVRGMLAEFLNSHYPDLPDISGRLLESLLKEFSAKSGTQGQLDGITDLIEKKGFTCGQFGSVIQGLAGLKSGVERLRKVVEGLKQEGMLPRPADRLGMQASKVQIQLVRDPQSRDALQWQHAVDSAVQHQESESYTDMLDYVSRVLQAVGASKGIQFTNEGGAKAIALLAIAHVDQESQAIGQITADKVQ